MVLLARNEVIVLVKVINLQLEAQQILVHARGINEDVSCKNILNTVKNQRLLFSVLFLTILQLKYIKYLRLAA